MVPGMRKLLTGKRLALAGLVVATLIAIGYGASADFDGFAKADPDDSLSSSAAIATDPGAGESTTPVVGAPAVGTPTAGAPVAGAPVANVSRACANDVLGTLRDVALRVYREGVASERTAAASVFIERSAKLREAVEREDVPAARAAARALLATGHMTAIEVTRAGRTLIAAGTSGSLAPVRGSISGASGEPIASYVTSVWSDEGFVAETNGIAEAFTLLRRAGRALAGSFPLPAGEPAGAEGELTAHGARYAYTSFAAVSYPEARPLRVYLFRSLASIAPLCTTTQTGTVDRTLTRIARLIYAAEGGPRAQVQVRRVQRNRALLQAVAAREPEATRLAIDKLLTEHIVRMRVEAGGKLLSDVGGPYVLAPVRAPLRLHGRQIGSVTLSVQDDEGYKRLAERLAGLDVLMYMDPDSDHPLLVKNSLGPEPGPIPASGPYTYRGRSFQAVTLHAEAFPSGPLRIVVLIPDPYPAAPGPVAPEHVPTLGASVRARATPTGGSGAPAGVGQAATSAACLLRRPASSCSNESENLATPSRSSVSVTSS